MRPSQGLCTRCVLGLKAPTALPLYPFSLYIPRAAFLRCWLGLPSFSVLIFGSIYVSLWLIAISSVNLNPRETDHCVPSAEQNAWKTEDPKFWVNKWKNMDRKWKEIPMLRLLKLGHVMPRGLNLELLCKAISGWLQLWLLHGKQSPRVKGSLFP